MMTALRRQALAWIAVALVTVMAAQTMAQPGPPFGRGRGGRGQGGRGQGGDPQFAADRDVFHFLLANHDQVRRKVTPRADGVETLTESDNPEIAAKIQEHVAAMHRRVVEVRPIHMRDPLFAEVFRHASQIEMKFEKTKQGVTVVETSKDPYVAKLIQAHAQVVDGFVKNGFAEAQKNHEIPARDVAAAATKPADEPDALALAPSVACAGCPNAAVANAACKTCPNAASCAASKACPTGTGAACATCPSAAQAGARCQACPPAAAASPACKACPNAASCATGKTCPGGTGAGCATRPSAAQAGPKCQACPPAAAASPACKACPNAATCAANKACPAGTGAGCATCPLSSQCPGGVACPAAKPDADAPPPPNQGAKKS